MDNKPSKRKWDGMCPAGKHGLDFRGQPCDLCPATDAPCAECGYGRELHRAYSRIDGGGEELGAYLGGRWHPFRASFSEEQ